MTAHTSATVHNVEVQTGLMDPPDGGIGTLYLNVLRPPA
jgi:hypothetical protein